MTLADCQFVQINNLANERLSKHGFDAKQISCWCHLCHSKCQNISFVVSPIPSHQKELLASNFSVSTLRNSLHLTKCKFYFAHIEFAVLRVVRLDWSKQMKPQDCIFAIVVALGIKLPKCV